MVTLSKHFNCFMCFWISCF